MLSIVSAVVATRLPPVIDPVACRLQRSDNSNIDNDAAGQRFGYDLQNIS